MRFDPTATLLALIDACGEWSRTDDPDARDAARADAIEALDELLDQVRGGEDLPNPDGIRGHLST